MHIIGLVRFMTYINGIDKHDGVIPNKLVIASSVNVLAHRNIPYVESIRHAGGGVYKDDCVAGETRTV